MNPIRFTEGGEMNIFLGEVLLSTLEHSTSTWFDRLTRFEIRRVEKK